jgi:predicted sugar kinase
MWLVLPCSLSHRSPFHIGFGSGCSLANTYGLDFARIYGQHGSEFNCIAASSGRLLHALSKIINGFGKGIVECTNF